MAFFESEWLGQGKHYNTLKIPEYVSQAKAKLLAMPEAIKAMISPDSMPLIEFLELGLPRKSSEYIPVKNQQFSVKSHHKLTSRSCLPYQLINISLFSKMGLDSLGLMDTSQLWIDAIMMETASVFGC